MSAVSVFDFFAAVFLLFLGIIGFRRGFIIEIGRIISLIFTLWLSITYYIDFAKILQQELSISPYFILFISFSIISIFTLIITRIIIGLIYQILSIKNISLLNQVLGFVGGSAKGAISIILILWAFELLPVEHWTDTLYKESQIATIAKTIREKNIEYFRLEDPVNARKEYIRSIIVDDSTIQEDD